MNAGGGVVLTVKLPRYRCVKSRNEPEGLPTVTELASGHTPEGEPFTISAFGSLNDEPFLSVDTGVDPELNEPAIGLGASKAFPWSLSIGCTPHPYAILYGILMPPGKSVVAQTPQGAVALNVIPVEPRVHAKGPLVYGVFNALPTELTVLGANGSTVYTENLQSKGNRSGTVLRRLRRTLKTQPRSRKSRSIADAVVEVHQLRRPSWTTTGHSE